MHNESSRQKQDRDSEHEALIVQNGILRSANQSLVLATVTAEELRDAAETARRCQNEFLAMLAHELRNPLAPISTASAMLGKLPASTPQLGRIKTIIDRQVSQLARLLDDLLDAARISSGKIDLQMQPLCLADQLSHALETVQARVAERKQVLLLDLPDRPVWICGDPVRLAQVFSNLLVNASKFTQDGGRIALRARVVDADVVISVEDNGAGIAADVLPTIFALFAQGPRTLARSEGGLGVGLNIVRSVAEMHGGSVSATSPGLGAGSVFTLRLPVMQAPEHTAVVIPLHAAPAARCRILLVEDNVDASELLQMVLGTDAHAVVAAFDGIAGLALACGGTFDVLICDIGLPGLTGYELVQTLRATMGASAPCCIAISGYGRAEDRARAAAAGFDHYLVKPIDLDYLMELLAAIPSRVAHVQ